MRWRRLGETIHLTALGVWLGALLMTGVAVGLMFPTMRELDPTLGAFSDHAGEHWSLGAGFIAARIFAVGDMIQFACAFLAFATLGAGLALWVRRSASGVVRAIAMGLAMALVSYWLFLLTPEMNTHLRAYWQAAQAGSDEAAAAARAEFDALHPVATRAMGAQAVLVLVSLVSGCWSALAGARQEQEAPRPGADEGAGTDGQDQ